MVLQKKVFLFSCSLRQEDYRSEKAASSRKTDENEVTQSEEEIRDRVAQAENKMLKKMTETLNENITNLACEVGAWRNWWHCSVTPREMHGVQET